MDKINVKIKLFKEDMNMPEYATDGSAAIDLRCAENSPITILPHERRLVPSGIAIEPDRKNVVALVCARSGLSSRHGIALANGVGVIDSDYRGEIILSLINLSDTAYTIEPNERIAQLIFMPIMQARIVEAMTLSETTRGAGGFGSTGSK